MASCGAELRLEIFVDPVGDWVAFKTRSDSTSLSNESVDVTDKQGIPWRILENCGLRSSSITSSGFFYSDNDSVMEWLTQQATESPFIQARLARGGTAFLAQGTYLIASFGRNGEYNGAEEFSINLESSGEVTETPAPPVVDVAHWWKMDEGSGATVTDYGTVGLDGALGSTASWFSGGPNGKPYYIESATTGNFAVLVNDSVDSFAYDGPFTTVAWIRQVGASQNAPYLWQLTPGSSTYHKITKTTGTPDRIRIWTTVINGTSITGVGPLVPNEWYRMCLVVDGIDNHVYWFDEANVQITDATLLNTVSGLNRGASLSQILGIGYNDSNTALQAAGFKFYKRALTLAELVADTDI